jgi:sulfhydrogenase subunit beta (sulfur reductase)
MAYLLKKEDFSLFVKLLMKSYDVYAPVRRGQTVVFDNILSAEQIDLSKNAMYPPKKIVFPAKEDMISFRKKKTLLRTEKDSLTSNLDTRKRVVLGMRMCDVSAMRKLDSFFLSHEEDPYYKARRENLFIIALHCDSEENDNCFCDSFENKDEGYDMYLQRTDEGFIVEVKTDKGKALVDKKIFKASGSDAAKDLPKCRLRLEKQDVDATSVAWQEYADKCLSCCACNIVCPTCSCFDVLDHPELDGTSGVRSRHWDYCQSQDYTKVAGGGIFRKGRTERFKHRLLCKFKYFKENIGEVTCTGCGRCVTVCPTKVCDIPKIIGDL